MICCHLAVKKIILDIYLQISRIRIQLIKCFDLSCACAVQVAASHRSFWTPRVHSATDVALILSQFFG